MEAYRDSFGLIQKEGYRGGLLSLVEYTKFSQVLYSYRAHMILP